MKEYPDELRLNVQPSCADPDTDLHAVASRASHKLNNLLAALRCQWDLLAAQADMDDADGTTLKLIGTMIDEAAEWTQMLSIACAGQAPTGKASETRSADASSPDCRK